MGTGYLIKTERVVLSLSADVTWCDIGHLPLGYPLQACSEKTIRGWLLKEVTYARYFPCVCFPFLSVCAFCARWWCFEDCVLLFCGSFWCGLFVQCGSSPLVGWLGLTCSLPHRRPNICHRHQSPNPSQKAQRPSLNRWAFPNSGLSAKSMATSNIILKIAFNDEVCYH